MKKFIRKQPNKQKVKYRKPEILSKLKPPKIPLFLFNKKSFKS
jgi:hypothetical protein